MNKRIGFEPKLIPIILSGNKYSTWRINDQKNLTLGDICEFVDSSTGQQFATAKLTKVFEKAFKDLRDEDKLGHEKYSSEKEMFETFENYYKKPINSETLVKVAWFELLK